MLVKNKVVYVPPVYEEIQHEVTSVDENNNPLRTSFHTDVSLLQRIDRADGVSLPYVTGIYTLPRVGNGVV